MNNDYNNDKELNTIIESLKQDMEAVMTEKVNCIMKKVDRNKYTKDIREILECGTKEEVYEIAKNLGYTKISSLNKAKLIEKVADEYSEKLIKHLYLIDEPRYKVLKYIVSKNGEIKLDNENEQFRINSDYFMNTGILFPVSKGEEAYFVMPDEAQQIIKELNDFEYRATIKRNSELINLFWGMINCYGILSIKDFKKLLVESYGYCELEDLDLKDILSAASKFYETFILNKDLGVHPLIPDIEEFKTTIDKKKNYCEVSKKEILKSAIFDYNLSNDAMSKFKTEFKMNWKITEEELSLLLYDLYGIIQVEPKEKVIELLCSDIELDNNNDVEKLSKIIERTVNNTRLWRLKGYKLSELDPKLDDNLVKKVGRNDPCICGSGKKYKKCCGKR